MKNLKNYGVQEMNIQEVNSVSGGGWPWLGYGFWGLWKDRLQSTEDHLAEISAMV